MKILWVDFLNSAWRDWRGTGRSHDCLDQPEWLATFLSNWELPAPNAPTATDLTALKEFRSLLRKMAEASAVEASISASDLHALNLVLAAAPFTRQLSHKTNGYLLSVVAVDQGWPPVIAEIGASFARTLTESESSRIRFCANADCLWVFYDETRNRSKRFCDDKVCGNLVKVRRFRARQKGLPDQGLD